MRILIIDYVTYLGHRNFNKIHVESLMRLGHSLHVVGRSSALEGIMQINVYKTTCLPQWSSRTFPAKSISERLKQIALLFWIKRKMKVRNYDLVVFLAYDIITLNFYRTPKPTLIVNHNNIPQLSGKFKLWLTRMLPRNYKHIVLTRDSEARLKSLLRNRDVIYIPHGFVKDCGQALRPDYLCENEKFLYCPVNGNYNEDFVRDIFCSAELISYLSNRNIKLIIKSKLVGDYSHNHIVKLEQRISEEEYRYLIGEAVAVILPYNENFKYRASGILYECIASDTPVIASRIESMLSYENHIKINFFDDAKTLVGCIQKTLESKDYKVDTTIFEPDKYWESQLKIIKCNEQ